jgi:hypothetical protein
MIAGLLFTVHLVGSILTVGYLLQLLSDLPPDSLTVAHKWKAAGAVLVMALLWPIFWAWLIWNIWNDMENDE